MTTPGIKRSANTRSSEPKRISEKEKTSLSALPPELLKHILSFLPKKDQAIAAQVSTQFAVATANAMQQNLYEDHAGLMAALKPLIDMLPQNEQQELPSLECFLPGVVERVKSADLMQTLFYRFELAGEHQHDSQPIIATILHRSLGLPLQDMMEIAGKILPLKSKHEIYSTIYSTIHLTISHAATGNYPHLDPLYLTPVAIDGLYKTALHLKEPQRSECLTEVSEKYLNINDLSKAEVVVKQTTPSRQKAIVLLGIANKYLEKALDVATPFYLESYNLKKGRELLKESVVADKLSNVDSLLSRICARYLEIHDLKEAENTVKEMHFTDDESWNILAKVSETYESFGNLPKAVELAKEIKHLPLRNSRLLKLSETYEAAKDFEGAFAVIDETSISLMQRNWILSQIYLKYSLELIKELKRDDIKSNLLEKLSRFEQLTEKYFLPVLRDYETLNSTQIEGDFGNIEDLSFIGNIENVYDKKNLLETLCKTLCKAYIKLNDLENALSVLQIVSPELTDDIKSDFLNSISKKYEDKSDLAKSLTVANQISNEAIRSQRIKEINLCISQKENQIKRIEKIDLFEELDFFENQNEPEESIL